MGNPDISVVLPDLRAGGAEYVNVQLANAFVTRGYSVECVLIHGKGELSRLLSPEISVVVFDRKRFRYAIYPLVRYIRRRRPLSMIVAMWPLTGLALIANAMAGDPCKVFVGEHTNFSHDKFRNRLSGAVQRALGRAIYERADGVIAVSEGVKQSLVSSARLEEGLVSVIYNPVRPKGEGSVIDPSIDIWMKSSLFTVIAVGSLKPAKDFPTLMRAFAQLRRTKNARLLILGEGGLRNQLQHLIISLGLSDSVLMPGFVNDPYPYLAKADLFVLSSAWEGLPGVLIEALVAGVPVVSTDCPSGPAEILENGKYGRLVPVGDPEALAAAMAEALDAPHDRDMLRRRGNEFSVERAADQYLALLDPGGKMLAGK